MMKTIRTKVGSDMRAIQEHKEEWIALSADGKKIVGAGATLKDALKEAHDHKENDPIVTKNIAKCGAMII